MILIFIEKVDCGGGKRAPSCVKCPIRCENDCEFDKPGNICIEKGIEHRFL